MLDGPHQINEPIYHNCGMIPFGAYAPLPNTSFLPLRIPLCLLFTTMHIRLMKIFTLLNILSEIHTDKVCLAKASQRRQDCQGQTALIDVSLTRAFYFSINNPLHQSLLRHVLTGSLDHAHSLVKSNLAPSPTCPHVRPMTKPPSIFVGIVPNGLMFVLNTLLQ